MFERFWDGQDRELAAYGLASRVYQQAPNQAPSASPNATLADRSTGAKKHLSRAESIRLQSICTEAKACNLSLQGSGKIVDVAAEVAKEAGSEAQDCQGGCNFARHPLRYIQAMAFSAL